MAENREYLTRAEENGSINIAEDVVAAIAADAIGEIEGVGSMCQNMTEQITEQFTGKKGLRGVRAEVKDGEIIVDVYLMVRYGYVIPADRAQGAGQRVRRRERHDGLQCPRGQCPRRRDQLQLKKDKINR